MENFSFRIQDIFRLFIPGSFLLIVFILFYGLDKLLIDLIKFKDFENLILVIFIIISVLLGYFVDMISSLCEKGIYSIMKKPSYHFLNKTKLVNFFFSSYEFNFATLVKENDNFDKNESTKIFNYYNRLKEKNKDEKTYEKLNSYFYSKILSRNITIVIAFILFLVTINKFSWYYFTIVSLILVLSLYRWLKLSFNYTRQVFIICEKLSK